VLQRSSAGERTAPAKMRTDVRVLVAEDNPVNQKVAVRQLEHLGIAADAVANGIEAVEATSRSDYAMVLMDVQMPEMDGIAATRELRRRGAVVPIVALTANALAGDRERCIQAGMDDYLAKPIAESELMRVLNRFLPRADGDGDVLDPTVVNRLRGISADFLAEIASIYLADAPARVSSIRSAVERGDAHALSTVAHAFKSGSGNVGATALHRICSDLEMMGREERLEGADEKVEELEREYARVASALQEWT
jgi:CheY-like chemotaxis protein/HPt (histidine-containing phosphotransfer) domain-containing protein